MKLILRDDVSLQADNTTEHVMLQWQFNNELQTIELTQLTPGIELAFAQMTDSGATMRELTDQVIGMDGLPALYRMHGYLKILEGAALIHRMVPNGHGRLVTLVPDSPNYKYQKYDFDTTQNYVLSRFAYWHREEDQTILESPLGYAKLLLHNTDAVLLMAELMKPQSCASLAKQISSIPFEKLKEIFIFLLNANLISVVDDEGHIQEDNNVPLRQWDFHDLLFHSRSRLGRTKNGYGGTFRFWGEIPSLPAVKPKMSDEFISLYKPDIETLKENDLPLAFVMENRKSIREYGEKPLTDKQLGEFLYRVARVMEVTEYVDTKNDHTETISLSHRIYPGGGARYELELYLTIGDCENIASGFYHYCPLEHRLYKVHEWDEQVANFLKRGTPAPGGVSPQILITLAARFQRMSWKYESTAYSVILKNCGVLYQSMYLVATAMGLASCGLGGGDSDLFAQLAGTDYYAETSVGEFALGSAPQ